ncbi:aldo/keto reductase [Paraburkholderia silvatlantica]|uniref:aldo/keto reductase n=1 Tax=Paraburkholderia silvatlantica TaxID=321895 RepID=UPI0037520BBB
MRLRQLGRTGTTVSEIGFGCGPTAGLMLYGTPGQRQMTVARALDLGINYFDTAPGYGNSISEINLGTTLWQLGATPVIATKVALSVEDLTDIGSAIRKSVEQSLRNLRIDRIPVIQLHNRIARTRASKANLGAAALLSVDDVLGPNGVVAALKALRRQGMVEVLGCSAYGGEMLAVEQVIESGAFDIVSVNYSVLNTTAWTTQTAGSLSRDYGKIGARAASAGAGIVALRVLEGGVLVDEVEPHQRTDMRTTPEHDVLVERARIFRLRLAGVDSGLSTVAIRFALSNPEVSCVLIGLSNVRQVEEAVKNASLGPLSDDLMSTVLSAV